MKTANYIHIATSLLVMAIAINANANNTAVQNYGHFKKMMHMKKTDGVVNLQKALPSSNAYAVGATHQALGEITVLDSKIWLDYGKDGLGNSINTIPVDEQALLLATSQVNNWQSLSIHEELSKNQLFKVILEKAKQLGIDTDAPFPFLLDGSFNKLKIHVINGQNPDFKGHGNKFSFLNKTQEERKNQQATVIGFYSASTQGVFTHPGESWHLHAVIKSENIGAHVDDLTTNKNMILKLPYTSN
jgi:acetolactate decarboxylase